MIFKRVKEETGEVLELYRSLIGTEYCVWDENYPTLKEIEFDISRDSLFCMKENNKIIGVISIDDDPNVKKLKCWSNNLNPAAELSRVAVALEWQNKGIAGLLLQNAMNQLDILGFKGVRLLVAKENIKAVKAYSKFKFSVVGECDLFGHDYWCYEKKIKV